MTLKRRVTRNFFTIAGLCGCLWGCHMNDIPDTENIYLPDYKGQLALIIGKDTLNVKDFLEEVGEGTNIQEDEDLKIFFTYEDSTEFEIGSDFVTINSFSNSKLIESPLSSPFTAQQDTVIYIERSIAFNFPASEGEQLDSTYYTSGAFELLLNSSFPGNIQYTASASSFKEIYGGEQISITSIAEYQGDVPVLDENSVALEGYKTELTSSSDSNKFYLDIDAAILIPKGSFLSGSEYLYFELNVREPTFSAVFGDFGRDTFNIKAQEISMDIFNEFGDSGIEFEAPTINFTFKNSFGIPVGLDFTKVYASYDDKEPLYLSGSITDEPQEVLATDLANFQSYTVSSIVLESGNSNIADLLSSSPDDLILDLSGISNVSGTTENFLLDTSKIMINSLVYLPLSLKLEEFEYESEFELEGLDALEGSEELSLVFNTVNELPFDGEVDLFFVRENGEEFDSLKYQGLFKSPTNFDEKGKAINPSVNIATINLDEEQIESLTTASELRLVTRLFSYEYQNDQFISIFSDYSMIVTLSVSGKVLVDLNSEN